MKTEAITIWFSLFCATVWAHAALPEPGPASPAPASGKPKIKFDQTICDFGKTSQVETVSGTFTFRNVGDAALRIGKPVTSCGCTVAGVKPDLLQPGEKGELTFTLNLGRNRAVLQKQITVESNDPENPRTALTVKADYTPLYEISPASFYVNLRQGEKTNLTVRVTRMDGKPLKLVKLTPSQSWIEARFEPERSSTNFAVRIEATVKPDGNPRYFNDLLNGFVEGSDRPAFYVPISGRLTGDLVLSPEMVYWPVNDPAQLIKTRRILVTSSHGEKLELKNLSSSIKGVAVEPAVRDDGKSVEIVATLVSVPNETVRGTIRFETNVPSQPTVELPVFINVPKRPVIQR